MDKWVIGFWGCYFGTTVLMLAGSALAFARTLRQISLNAALSALASAFFVVAFLGGFPLPDAAAMARFQAHIATLVSGLLAYQLLAILGLLRSSIRKGRAALGLGAFCVLVLAVGWWLAPINALAFSTVMAGLLGFVALLGTLYSIWTGARLAWVAVLSVFFMLVALTGLGWIALSQQQAPWPVHVVSAVAATLYLVTMAGVLWMRFAYLVELHEAMAQGPSYDPVTRMRSHAETGKLVGTVFRGFRQDRIPLGIIVLTIANIYALEKLHGFAAVNSALFVCAGRLRRAVPANVEIGRLGSDGFLLVMRHCTESGRLIDVARSLESRLHKSVVLNTSSEVSQLESDSAVWRAEIGVGVMVVSNPAVRGSSAVAMARGMSRTAISYASRIAWYDQSSAEIVELPVLSPE